MVAFPFAKIFTTALKTVSKPVARRIINGAQRYQSTRGALSMVGEGVHRLSKRMDIYSAGHTAIKIKALDKEKAVKAGGEFLAEVLVFTFGGCLVVLESAISNRDKARKDAIAKAKKAGEEERLANALQAINERLLKLESAVTQRGTQGVVPIPGSLPRGRRGVMAPPLPGQSGVPRDFAGAAGAGAGGESESASWTRSVESRSSSEWNDKRLDDPGR